jgi:hypothetical protein
MQYPSIVICTLGTVFPVREKKQGSAMTHTAHNNRRELKTVSGILSSSPEDESSGAQLIYARRIG